MRHLKLFHIWEAKINKPNIRKIDFEDFLILQGRDAISNDHLTFEIATEEDWWFHAKGVPGSHVVIKNKQKLPDKRIIYKAAEVAAKNSAAAKREKKEIDVIFCKKKFVTKSSGMKIGEVAVDEKNSEIIKVKL